MAKPGSPARWFWYFWSHEQSGRRQHSLGRCDPSGRAGLDFDRARDRARDIARQLDEHAGASLLTLREIERASAVATRIEQERRAEIERHTLGDLVVLYVEVLKTEGRTRSAADVNSVLLRRLTGPHSSLAQIPAAKVTSDQLMSLVRELATQGKSRTAGKIRSYLHAAFERARQVDAVVDIDERFRGFHIEHNPVSKIRVRGNGVRPRGRVLSDVELGTLMVRLRRSPSHAADALRVLIDLAGQRQVQLLRLKVADVDSQKGLLTLLDSKGRRAVPRDHVLPIVGRSRRVLKRLVTRAQDRRSDYVFSTSGRVPLRDETIREIFNDLARGSGIPVSDRGPSTRREEDHVRLSDIRRTAETFLQEQRFSREERGQLLSHGQAGVQGRHYERSDMLEVKTQMLLAWQKHLVSLERAERRRLRQKSVADARDPAPDSRNSTQPRLTGPIAGSLVTLADLRSTLRVSQSTLVRLRARAEFPEPTLLVGRSPRWTRSQVAGWIASQQAAGTG
jgi:predicted DNA-binding transcriptional regulator AlpA